MLLLLWLVPIRRALEDKQWHFQPNILLKWNAKRERWSFRARTLHVSRSSGGKWRMLFGEVIKTNRNLIETSEHEMEHVRPAGRHHPRESNNRPTTPAGWPWWRSGVSNMGLVRNFKTDESDPVDAVLRNPWGWWFGTRALVEWALHVRRKQNSPWFKMRRAFRSHKI